MSLLPFLMEDFVKPSRLLDQHFGLSLDPEDALQPLSVPRMLIKCPAGYLRNWRSSASHQDTGSTVTLNKDNFVATLDVQQFKPEEIVVKHTGKHAIIVEGKHEEKQDEHGHIYRHFIRKYVLPKNCDVDNVKCDLSSDGVLTIVAPKIEGNAIEHKEVPINQTGAPARALEQPEAGDKK